MECEELRQAQALRVDIEAAADAAEHQRHVSADLIDKLNAAGLFAMNIPRRFGGAERDAPDSLKVIEELSYADSAVGWCAMIYSTTAVLGVSGCPASAHPLPPAPPPHRAKASRWMAV